MRLIQEIRERRLIPIMVAYLVTGFVAVEAVSQLVGNGVLPNVANSIIWVLYVFGIAGSLTFAWFHGAPGRQYAVRREVVIHSVIAIAGIATAVQVYRTRPLAPDFDAASGLPLNSVAVLYFEDASAAGDLGYVAEGITDALIEQLDDVPSLDVVSRNGVLPFRDAGIRSDSIAQALRVGTLIDGSVDQRGDQLRITTRLVDGFSGADIERAVLEMPSGQFLAARDSVAGSVSRLLRQRLGEEVRVRELRSGTTSDEAWALVQRAERLRTDAEDNFESGGETSASVGLYQVADSLLDLAEQLDPQWTRPPGYRAQVAYRLAWFAAMEGDLERGQEEIEIGVAHANRALSLDSGDAYALEQRGTLNLTRIQVDAAMGQTDGFDELVESARSDLEEAVRRDPSLATAHAMLSFLLAGLPDMVGAVIEGQRALEEDAYLRGADRVYDRLFQAQYQLGNLRDAQNWCDEGRERFPDNWRFTDCALWLLATPEAEPDVDAAWDLLARLDTLAPEQIRPLRLGVGQVMVAGVLRRAGLPDSASAVLSRVDRSERTDPQSLIQMYEAGILASTGDPDGGLDALRRYVAATPGAALGAGQEQHWWWQSLRGRPEFERMIASGN